MTLPLPDRSATTFAWASIAVMAGLAIAALPMVWAVMVIGVVGLSIVLLLEPTLALVMMLLLAPMKTLIETEFPISLPVDVGQMTLALALGVWLLRHLQLQEPFLNPFRIGVFSAVSIFASATLVTVPLAISVGTAINEWLKWFEMLLLIYLISDESLIRWPWLIVGLLGAGITQALIGIYQFQGGSGAPHLWILDYQYFRAFGTFGQPNPFGAFMGLMLPLSLGLAWGLLTVAWQDRRFSNIILLGLALAASAIVLIGLLVSWSRGAWIGFAGASIVLLWITPLNRWQGTLLLIGAMLIGGLLYVSGQVPPQISERVLNFTEDFTGFQDVRGVPINDDNYAVVERLAHWQSALAMATDHPWLGVGFGNYEPAYPDYQLVNWPDALGHAHNYYLNVLAETGIVGLLAYLVMWSIILGINYRVLASTIGWQRGVAIGLMGVWIHLAVHSFVDKLYVNNIFLHIGVLLGVLGVLHRHQLSNESM